MFGRKMSWGNASARNNFLERGEPRKEAERRGQTGVTNLEGRETHVLFITVSHSPGGFRAGRKTAAGQLRPAASRGDTKRDLLAACGGPVEIRQTQSSVPPRNAPIRIANCGSS